MRGGSAVAVSRDDILSAPIVQCLPIGRKTESAERDDEVLREARPASDIAGKRMKSYREIAAGLSVVYTGWDGMLVGGGRKRAPALY